MIEIDFKEKPIAKQTIPDYIIDKFGDKRLFDENGCLHSFDDKPSLKFSNGIVAWHKHGKLHRENQRPAVIYPSGDYSIYEDGIKLVNGFGEIYEEL